MSLINGIIPFDLQTNRKGRVNPGSGSLIVDETTRLTGTMFGATLDTRQWTVANNGTASAAALGTGATAGIAVLTSGTANNGYGSIISTRHGRFLFVNPNLFRMAARLPDTTEANNTRYIGAMDITAGNPPTLNNGFYFAYDGTGALSVNMKVAGVAAVSVASGSFNGETGTGANGTYAVDANVHAYEILYFVMGAWFFIDGVLIHKFTPTTLTLTNDLDLHCFAMSLNSAGGTESADLEVWASSILRLGKELTRPSFLNITSNTTTVCKYGTGSLHAITINTKPTTAGTATIYDNTAASGTIIATIDINNSVGNEFNFGQFGLDFQTGLTVVTAASAGTPNLTVVFD